MKRRVLLLGGSRYTLRSIAAARELGCDVVVIDRNPDAEGFRHADFHEVVDIADARGAVDVARKYEVAAVIPLSDFGVRSAAAVAEALGLTGLRPDEAEQMTRKSCMRRQWDLRGVPSVRWRLVASAGEALRAADELATWPLIVKPDDSRGGGSRGVTVVESRVELCAAVETALACYAGGGVVIEEFVRGIEHSVETFTFGGETRVLAVSDKVKSPLPYRVDLSVVYPTRVDGERLDAIAAACRAAVCAMGIRSGPAHVELCTTDAGPRLFELGARCGGGATPDPIVPYVTGIEQLKETVRVALGEAPESLAARWSRGCVYRFLSPAAGRVAAVRGVDEVRQWPNVLDCAVTVERGDEIRPLRAVTDRAGFLIAGGQTREDAIALADRAEQQIRFEYA
jgi:biotin carboxylase